MQINYIPIYKVAQLSEDGTGAVDQLAARHTHARRTTDEKHIVFCETILDYAVPYIAEEGEEAPSITEQQHILDWIALEDSTHALWVTLNELQELDSAELLGAIRMPDIPE